MVSWLLTNNAYTPNKKNKKLNHILQIVIHVSLKRVKTDRRRAAYIKAEGE